MRKHIDGIYVCDHAAWINEFGNVVCKHCPRKLRPSDIKTGGTILWHGIKPPTIMVDVLHNRFIVGEIE